MKVIKRMIEKNKKVWDSKMQLALWVDRTIVKKVIGQSPFNLVYGVEAKIPHNKLIKMYKFVQEYNDDICDLMQHRMEELIELDKTRREAHK